MSDRFYVVDEGPNRWYATLAEAREDAEKQIDEYRREARRDGEWSDGVESICIYLCKTETDEPVEDGALVMQAEGYLVPTDDSTDECWEFRMEHKP